ncbi:MAG: HEPN domain-containing protein, partial [Solirubrobacterales bacterium]
RECMNRLSRHYIPARFPDAHAGGEPGDHFGASDSEQAIRDAEATIEFVDRCWELARGDQGG